MKVLMLGWELPPHHVGGMGIACYQMCQELVNHGVDIDFVLPYSAEHGIDFMNVIPAHPQSVEDFQWTGGTYDPENFSETIVKDYDGNLDLRQQHDLFAHNVGKLAKYAEFDIIHAHDWLTFRAAIEAKRVSGKPLIAHVHATQFDQSACGHGNPMAREIEYECLTVADEIFAVSEYTKQVIVREYGIPSDKVQVVHNSMEINTEIDESHNVHRYLEIMKKHGYKVVTNIGRKTIQKGLTHLIEAAKKVIEKNPKVIFVLAGGGEQEEELIQMAAHFGISRNVIFIDWISGKNWRDTFRISDVFVMPSVSEPFGLTPLEAIGFGTPVIITKQSGVAEVLSNCFKVDFWDTDQMADMIIAMCENDSLARTMWENSYNEYLATNWKNSAQKMKMRYHHKVGAPA